MKNWTLGTSLIALSVIGTTALAAPGDTLQDATQRGANYLVTDVYNFARGNNCQACHRQGAALFGMAEAFSNGYTLNESDSNGVGYIANQNVAHQGPFRGAPTGRYWHTGGTNRYQNSTSSYSGFGLAGYDRYVTTRFSSDIVEAADDAVLRQTVSGNLGYWSEEHHNFPTTYGYVQNTARHMAVLAQAMKRADPSRRAAYQTALDRAEAYIRSRVSDDQLRTDSAGRDNTGYVFLASWALLGLKEAGVSNTDADIVTLKTRIFGHESNSTGSSWGYSNGHAADPFNTGLALYALCRTGETLANPVVSNAATWLNNAQNTSGYWNSPTHASHDIPTTFAMLGLGCYGALGVEIEVSGRDRVEVASASPTRQIATFTLTVRNTGAFGGSDSYSLSVLGGLPGWSTSLSTQVINVTAGQSQNVTLTVTTDTDLPPALPVDFSVRATSQSSPDVSEVTSVTVYTDPPPPVVGLNTTVELTAPETTQGVTWTNLGYVFDASVDRSGLLKTRGTTSWDAGTYSNEQIPSGEGFLEFIATETNTHRMVGLANGNSNNNWNDIDYAFYLLNNGTVQIREYGSNSVWASTYQTGDVFRIAVDAGTVRFYQNGTLVRTAPQAATYPLNVDTSFHNMGATVRGFRISSNGVSAPVTWGYEYGVIVPNGLSKTVSHNNWNGGAFSNEQILEGAGYVETIIGETNQARMIGLSHGDSNLSYTDIDFAAYMPNNGILHAYQNSTNRGSYGAYQTGDVIRVSVTAEGQVSLQRNGTTVYTWPGRATFPLNVDTSLYHVGATIQATTISGRVKGTVRSRLASTPLLARVRDQNGALVTGPSSGVVTFYVAGVPVANDTDADGDGIFSADWTPGSGWSANGVQDYRAIYSGIDRPEGEADLLSSLAANTLLLDLGVDSDSDGIEDDVETNVVGTDPNLADTDGDGCLDGSEYYGAGSNPLVVDTDGDGVNDCYEITAGTDPTRDTSFPDADEDGISDVADPFPCDSKKSAVVFLPSEGNYGQLQFEDNWPEQGDLDFNDAVVAYNYQLFQNSDGLVTSLVVTLDPLALGADIDNGLFLALPVSATALDTATQVIDGVSASLDVQPDESHLVVELVGSLRDLFGGAAGQLNTHSANPVVNGEQVVVTLEFNAPFVLPLGTEPFDLFFARGEDVGHQIHRPAYAGTDRMRSELFSSADDGSSDTRHFVDTDGLPFVLSYPTLAPWTEELVEIPRLFPNIVSFASSNGAEAADFYSTSVVQASAYAPSLSIGSHPSVSTVPATVYDRSCTVIPAGGN